MTNLKKVLIILLIIPLLTSCWSRRELNELAITTGLAIDKVGDKYLVTAQVLDPAELAAQQQTSTNTVVTTYTSKGTTIFEAIRKLTLKSPRKLYLAHLRLVVFGEEIAKEGLKEVLDLISRDHEMRTDFFIVVAKDQQGAGILKVLTSIEKVPTMKIFSAIENSDTSWAAAKGVQLDELISKIISDGNNPVLTGVYLTVPIEYGEDIDNKRKITSGSNVVLDHLAAFREDKLVGWLNEEESIGYEFIIDEIKNTIITVPCEDEKMSVEIFNSSTTIKGKVENGKPSIKINVESEGSMGELQCTLDVTKEEVLKEIASKVEKDIKDKIMKSVEKAQQDFKADIFGFGETIHRENPGAWKKLTKDWNENFSNLDVEVSAKVNIRRLGTINKSFQ